jgi:hypothetical protein
MAFRTRYGYFKYLVLPFRLINGLVDVFYIVYLNNILIFSKNLEEY